MSSIDPEIRKDIVKKLSHIESEYDVEILFAIESGSRAWGFESIDSDYDVRFVYRHKPSWYFNVLPKRDVIELPIVGVDDYSGWDIRKALFLLNKSNPVFFEWLRSPIVYREETNATDLLRQAADKYFSPVSSIYHYLHMATGNNREYLQSEQVKIKKYFYVLRPLLACMWVEAKNSPPPMKFEELLNAATVSADFKEEVLTLLSRKKASQELGLEPRIPVINDFIKEKIEYFLQRTRSFDPATKPDSEYLNDLLWEIAGPRT
ncbi:nucleotidyltransferase domain-containing protein [Aeromonas caviae]|uniref:nucleotidyltransferase domain-containing protein n=1 Tax=Aeromonas caviae TaxID=648 RepID=UPI0029DACB4B|nr:nucleotidyltransferase domain-containing protein [Aeromonas caviae]MDX7839461.1 nucleotidyltransferase domain-containing protein [Aeromonas caviae]